MPLPAADLRAIFQLEPKAAIAYLKRKGYNVAWNWQEQLDAAHARAFTVAKVARLDVLQDIRGALADALKEGQTLQSFQKNLTPTLQAKGWWGKQIVVDSQGQAEVARLGSPARLGVIYRTNTQAALNIGRQQAMLEAVDSHPNWEYVAVLDSKTRPSHRAMNGRVYPANDPIWATCCPLNGYGCRCRLRPRSDASVKRAGLKVQSSAGKLRAVTVDAGMDKRTGEIYKAQRTGIDLPGGVFFAPDAGFNASPLASHVMDDLLYRKALSALPDRATALQEVQDILLSEPRMQGWTAFVDGALAAGAGRGQTMALGVLADADIAFAEAQGETVDSGIIFLEDKLLAGPKAQRHAAAGNALSREEWISLPEALAKPDQVVWDVANKALLYILPGAQGKPTKAAVRFNRMKGDRNDAATVFKVATQSIADGLRSGAYLPVR